MAPLLSYLIKSTICLSVLYLVFRWTLKKEKLFTLNRFLLLSILIVSVSIPFIHFPNLFHQRVQVNVLPEAKPIAESAMDNVAMRITTIPASDENFTTETNLSIEQITGIIYVLGLILLFFILITGLLKLMVLLSKTKIYRKNNFRLALVEKSIAPMSIGRFIILSKQDYKEYKQEIVNHELAHLKFRHTYDLLLVELVKLLHWFNPLIYQLRHDLKEIQEFQVDRHLLSHGTNSKEYQLLLIKKCVGNERYALANSFNHCQIKNRIVMMNSQKKSKGKAWKVAIFLPVVLLMLMAFGKPGELVSKENPIPDLKKNWSEADFGKPEFSKVHGFISRSVLINSNFDVVANDKVNDWNEVAKLIWQCLDYNSASGNLKDGFERTVIGGKEVMVQKYTALTVRKDRSTPEDIYQNFLNFLGNEVLKIRQKHANEIYQTTYEQLTQDQKITIDQTVPAIIFFQEVPIQDKGLNKERPSFNIEVRAEGIYVLPDNTILSLNEMKEKVKVFAEKPGHWMVDVKIAAGLKDEKVAPIKEVLQQFDKLGVRYISFDPVYIQVEKMAEFPGGNNALRKWLEENISYPEEAINKGISGKVYMRFIVNSKGKVVFPKVIRGLSPALDKEAIRITSMMPNWQPATQNGTPVSVSYSMPVEFDIAKGKQTGDNSSKIEIHVDSNTITINGEEIALEYLISEIETLSKDNENPMVNVLFDKSTEEARKEAIIERLRSAKIKATASEIKPPPVSEILSVDIRQDGIYINNKPVSNRELKEQVNDWLADNPDIIISMRVANGVSDEKVYEVSKLLEHSKVVKDGNSSKKMIVPPNIKYHKTVTKQTTSGDTPKVVISVNGNNLTLDGQTIAMDQLAFAINKQYENIQHKVANVTITKDTKPETIEAVKEQLRKAKLLHINYYSVSK